MDLVSVCKNTPKIKPHYLNKKKKKKEYQEEIHAWRQIFVPHRIDSSYK
jgi:hypothetical protein